MSVGTNLRFGGCFFFLLLIPEVQDTHSAKLGEAGLVCVCPLRGHAKVLEETLQSHRQNYQARLGCLWPSFVLHRCRCWESDPWYAVLGGDVETLGAA